MQSFQLPALWNSPFWCKNTLFPTVLSLTFVIGSVKKCEQDTGKKEPKDTEVSYVWIQHWFILDLLSFLCLDDSKVRAARLNKHSGQVHGPDWKSSQCPKNFTGELLLESGCLWAKHKKRDVCTASRHPSFHCPASCPSQTATLSVEIITDLTNDGDDYRNRVSSSCLSFLCMWSVFLFELMSENNNYFLFLTLKFFWSEKN